MDLTPYVDTLRRELAVAAEAGGDEARELAERLTAPLESATRLTMLNVLSAAMDEITRELAPGSVDVRLRGLDPDFVVTLPPADGGAHARAGRARRAAQAPGPGRRRRGRHRPRQSASAGPPQGPRRGGREPRGPVGQRVAGAGRVGRGRRRHPAAYDGEDPDHRTELHGLGALTAHLPTRSIRAPLHPHHVPPAGTTRGPKRTGQPCLLSTLPNRSRSPPTWSAGSIQFTAGDRLDTVVEVRPRDPKQDQDVRAAEQTEVTYASGVLTVRTPKERCLVGRTGTVDVTVELPTGSRVDMTGAWTQVLGEGRLGEVRVKTSAGDVRLDTTGPLQLTASHGSITVDRVEGTAEITTSSGSLRVGTVDGPAVLKNSHGTTTVGAVDRRPAGERRQRRHRHRARRGLGRRHHRPRHPAGRRSRPRHRPVGDLLRRHRGRHPRGHRRLARRQLQRAGRCATRSPRPRPRRRPRTPSRSAPGPDWGNIDVRRARA